MMVLLEIARCVGIFGVDEGARLRAFCIFKPTVAIGDFGAEVVVDHWLRIDCRRSGQRNSIAAMDGLGESAADRKKQCNPKSGKCTSSKFPLPDRIRGHMPTGHSMRMTDQW